MTPAGPISHPVSVRARHGGITLRVTPGSSLDVEAASTAGELQVDVPGWTAQRSESSRTFGRVGAGGVAVDARRGPRRDVRVVRGRSSRLRPLPPRPRHSSASSAATTSAAENSPCIAIRASGRLGGLRREPFPGRALSIPHTIPMRPDSQAIFETSLEGAPLWRRGKVRDVYDLGEHLLIVATDRLSAFDVVLPTPIPGKGRVLTQLSLFWFSLLRTMVPNHVRSSEVERLSRSAARAGRPAGGPVDDGAEDRSAARRVRRARIPRRTPAGRTIRRAGRCAASSCRRGCASRIDCRSRSSRPRPRRRRGTTRA